MAFNQQDGLVINKSFGIIGKALDQRSQVRGAHFYRDYFSTAEVLERLTGESLGHTAEIRAGKFPIYVTDDLTGVMTTYWFRDGPADDQLVEFFPEAADVDSINEGLAEL